MANFGWSLHRDAHERKSKREPSQGPRPNKCDHQGRRGFQADVEEEESGVTGSLTEAPGSAGEAAGGAASEADEAAGVTGSEGSRRR